MLGRSYPLKFHTTLLLEGKTATGVAVPPEVVEGLGKGKRPAVRVTINGYTYRSTVAPLGGRYLLPVSAEVRAGARISAGDALEVEVELDTEPRVITIPDDLAAALDQDAAARRFFDDLSYSNQRGIIQSVEGAKTAETRQRRIAKALEKLRAGRV